MSDDVKDVVEKIQPKFSDFPIIKRFDNIQFGHKPELQDVVFNQKGVYVAKIVDDSNFVPNSEYIRSQIASGAGSMNGVYDFEDGKDNGFTPRIRGLGFDMAEIDAAAKATIEEAKSKSEKAKQDKIQAAKEERNNKILDNLASLSDSSSDSKSE